MKLVCNHCGSRLECLAGHSAHSANWYCPNDCKDEVKVTKGVQTRLESFLETVADLGTGFVIAWYLTMYLSNFLNIKDEKEAFIFTCIFTVVSIVRRYFFRRLFNHFSKGSV